MTLTYLADDDENGKPLKSKFVITRQRAALPRAFVFILGQVEAWSMNDPRAVRRAWMAEATSRLKASVNDFSAGEICAVIPNKTRFAARKYSVAGREPEHRRHAARGPPRVDNSLEDCGVRT